jgi:hypothetical protein
VLLVQQDRRQKATFSVDDDALVLRSVRLNHSPERRSPCRLSPLRRSGDSLGVSRRSPLRSLAGPPYVALPLYPLFCMAEFISLCIPYVVDITRKMSARFGTV